MKNQESKAARGTMQWLQRDERSLKERSGYSGYSRQGKKL
jgi:hypothetical protein